MSTRVTTPGEMPQERDGGRRNRRSDESSASVKGGTDHGTGPCVALIQPNRDAYSETFIRAHLERLPARVECLFGSWFPTQTAEGQPLLKADLTHRLARAAVRRVLGWKQSEFQERAFCRFLHIRKVDVVLAEYGPTGVAVMDACRRARLPLVVHFHGFDAYERATLQAEGARYPELFASAAAIVVVSRHMEQRLLDLGAPQGKVVLNPYGVDTAAFSGSDPSQAPPVFIAVGRFVEKKAPYLTLLAFERVHRSCEDAKLVFVGDGPLLDSCRQLACGLRVHDSVEFRGALPHHEVAALMRRARAFVQHSVVAVSGDSEGTPVAVIEAASAGLPIVSTRHAGIPEVVLDGRTGFIVAELDVEQMAKRMLELALDSSLAARLGAAGRQRVIDAFLMERSIGRLWQVLLQAASRETPAAGTPSADELRS